MGDSIKVLYFGYGANADLDMIEAITGRRPDSFDCILEDHILFIEKWSDISLPVRLVLSNSWGNGSGFSSYMICGKKGEKVYGKLWMMTQFERDLINNWELNDGLWQKRIEVIVHDAIGNQYKAETETALHCSLQDIDMRKLVKRIAYKTFLNNKSEMLKKAEAVSQSYREEYSI